MANLTHQREYFTNLWLYFTCPSGIEPIENLEVDWRSVLSLGVRQRAAGNSTRVFDWC